MTKRYYFCIRYTPVQADYELLAGRCISQMHLFMVNNRQSINKIGVSFPDWSDVTVGQTIAFVAEDKEMMIGLSFQPYFSLMVNEGLFEISSVFEVPDNAIEVRFTRNQTIGKSFLGSKKRRIKRSMRGPNYSMLEHHYQSLMKSVSSIASIEYQSPAVHLGKIIFCLYKRSLLVSAVQ